MDKKIDTLALNKKTWDKIAKKYEEHRPKWPEKDCPLFKYFLSNLQTGSLILDIGSGTGLPYAKKLIENGFKVLGIDISPTMVKIAKKNVPQGQFKQLSMTDLDYENKFEGVISSFSMLLLDPEQFNDVAKRIVRALKKGGFFYLSLNEPEEENIDVDNYDYTIIEIMGQKMYSRPYTEKEVLTIFSSLGMKLMKLYRKMQTSELYGTEFTINFIFKKE